MVRVRCHCIAPRPNNSSPPLRWRPPSEIFNRPFFNNPSRLGLRKSRQNYSDCLFLYALLFDLCTFISKKWVRVRCHCIAPRPNNSLPPLRWRPPSGIFNLPFSNNPCRLGLRKSRQNYSDCLFYMYFPLTYVLLF